MTLRKNNGKWSMTKIGVFAGILASAAICIEATPTAWAGLRAAIAPWTSLPAKVEELSKLAPKVEQMAKDVSDIKVALHVDEPRGGTVTNSNATSYTQN